MLTAKAMSSELKRSPESFFPNWRIWRIKTNRPAMVDSIGSQSPLEDLAVFHHELHIFQCFDVMQRIAVDGNNVRERPRCQHPDLSLHVEHDRGARGRALDGLHRRHAEFRHPRELLRDGLGPWNPAHIGAEGDSY